MMGSIPPRPPETGRHRPTVRLAAVAILVVAFAVTAFVALDFNGLSEWTACPHTCPSDFAPGGIQRAAPGSTGCQGLSGEVCYEAEYAPSIPGLTLAGLWFSVAAPVNQTLDPKAPDVLLGPNATVSALGPNGQIVGVWNMHSATWLSGAAFPVPSGSNDAVVLDTNLQSNATLSNAYFYIQLAAPNSGGVGFPLFCAGC
jgi:hypothetical protein